MNNQPRQHIERCLALKQLNPKANCICNSWVLKEFLRHCYEAKSAEYHVLDYVVMSRKRYEEVMKKAYPKKGFDGVWIDEASE